MQIAACHSHLGGLEFLKVHKPALWDEIEDIIQSAEATTDAPAKVGVVLSNAFRHHGWIGTHVDCSTTEAAHLSKERISAAVHFGARSVGPYGFFAKHLASYVGDAIDLGVEILPMKELQVQMAPGVTGYEEAIGSLRRARSIPAVPLILIGIAP